MGDRTYYYYDCPKCGLKDGVEVYDHSSALMYVEACQDCDYYVDLDYYEESENYLVLLSKADARDKGYLCNKCDQYLWLDEREIGLCRDCKG